MGGGHQQDLGGRTLEILPALIHDLPASYWAYDDQDKTLFVSDGFAFSHYDSAECILLSHELPKPPTAAEARLVLDLALYWSRYADNAAIVTDLAEMLRKYETRMICPAHGSVITEPSKLLAVMDAALRGEIGVYPPVDGAVAERSDQLVHKVKMDVAAQQIEALEYLASRRRSCRAFKPTPLARESIQRILGVAQKAASWCNSQPWQIIITSGDETARFREAMYNAARNGAPQRGDFPFPREYQGVYAERRRESGFQLYSALNIPRGDKLAYARQALENFNFFGAPHVAVVTTDEALGVYGAVDCGAYVANFLLAAEASGVAAVPQASLAFYSDVVREHFGLGSDRKILCGISLGIADPDHPANSFRTSRAELAEVVSFVGD